MFKFSTRKLLAFDRFDLLFIGILIVGIFLRLWLLETHLIFFGDIGRDFLVARDMITHGNIPLLGIPSSIPRFHQGPIMIWFIALGLLLSNGNPVFVGYLTALIGILTMMYLYILVRSHINSTAAVVSAAILASSPLAVAHSRMPYHTAPLPLMTVFFLHMLLRMNKDKKWSGFFIGFAWAAVFQFELAMFPLILLPLIYWFYQYKNIRTFPFLKVLSGVALGLTPQILYDLTHAFSHLGGFLIWVIYRIVSFLGYGREHTVSSSKLTQTVNILTEYFSRILIYDQPLLGWLILISSIGALIYVIKKSPDRISQLELLTVGSLGILLASFFVHSSPSEAYFPPFCVILAILIGGAWSKLPGKFLPGVLALILVIVGYNLWSIYTSNFFIAPTPSYISYGPGYGEQYVVVDRVHQIVGEKSFTFASTDPDAHFDAYLSGYRYINQYLGKGETTHDPERVIFIDHKSEDIQTIPGAVVYEFPSVHVGVLR